MPPLKGIDRGLTGEALKALEESGHGRRIAIVDPSYNIPKWAQVIDYRGPNSAQALLGIVKLVPVETEEPIVFMRFDPSEEDKPVAAQAYRNFTETEYSEEISPFRVNKAVLPRLDQDAIEQGKGDIGFYSIANNEAENTLFIRTPDTLPYACVTFVIGHSQITE